MDNQSQNSGPANNNTGSVPRQPIAIPATWPGAMGAFRLVRPAVKRIFWTIFGAYVLYFVVDLIINVIFKKISVLGNLVGVILESLLIATIYTLYYAAIRDEDVSFGEALNKGLSRLFDMVLVIIICGVLTILSFVLLIVPFFFVFPRLVFAPILVITQNMKFGEAISTSWRISKGNVGKVYGLVGLEIAIFLLVITIVGIPWAIYWGTINYGSYVLLTMYASQEKAATPTPVTPAAPVAPAS